VFSVRYELDIHIPDDGIPRSYRRENPKSYMDAFPSSSEWKEELCWVP
jgi:hypothetical protein